MNFSEGGSGPTFFRHAKFEVKNFFGIYSRTKHSTLWIFQRGSGHQLLQVMPNLRSKNFSEFFHLQSTLDSEFFRRGSGQTFFHMQNLRSKNLSEIFHLPSTLDSEFFRERGLGVNFFGSCQIWDQKIFRIFSFTEYSGQNLWGGVWTNFFWSCQIWDQKFFSFTEHSGLWIFQRGVGSGTTFFGHTKFEVKKFFGIFSLTELSALWIFQREGLGTKFFWSHQIWKQKFFRDFFIYWVLWTEFLRWGSGPTFLVMPNLRSKKFFGIFSLTKHSALWIFQRGVRAPNFSGHAKFETKNFFHLLSTMDSEFFKGGIWDNIFWSLKIWGQKIFQNFFIYRALWTLNFTEGSLSQLFIVMPNLRSKNFSEFFHLQSTLDSEFLRWGSGETFLYTPNLRSKNFS